MSIGKWWNILIVSFFFLFPFVLFSQDSRFEVFLRKSDNSAQTGASVYVKNLATDNQYILSEVVGAGGLYRRDDVPLGVYSVYVNGALRTTNRFHGTNQIYLTLNEIDPDGNYKIDTQGYEDSSVTKIKLSTTVNVLLDDPGSGVAFPPDDVGLEFKINGVDTLIGIKDDYINDRITDSLADLRSQIRSEISDSIAANSVPRVVNGLTHEYRWNDNDARGDSIYDVIGNGHLKSVGITFNSTVCNYLRKWSYPEIGFSFGYDRFTCETNLSEFDFTTEEFALETKVFFSDPSTEVPAVYEFILEKGTSPNNFSNYALCRDPNGYPTLGWYNGGWREVKDSSTVMENDRWYHIAVNISSDSVYFYIDGEFTWKKSKPAAMITNIYGFFLGGNYDSYNRAFHGQILFCRIYNRNLTAAEWNENFEAELGHTNSAIYMQNYVEYDEAFAKIKALWPDSASGRTPQEYFVMYDSAIDTFRVFFSNLADTTLRVCESGDTLQTLTNSSIIDTKSAVPYLYIL